MSKRITPRQRQVAELVACGYTNAEIAAALEVSPNTIKKHLKDLFATLQVSNRTELAVSFTSGPDPAAPRPD